MGLVFFLFFSFLLVVFLMFLVFLGVVLHTDRKATVCSDRAGSSGFALVETKLLFLGFPPDLPCLEYRLLSRAIIPTGAMICRVGWSLEVTIYAMGFL